MKNIFVLLADGDGCTFSVDRPWGAAVTTEEKAKRYVKGAGLDTAIAMLKLGCLKVLKTQKMGYIQNDNCYRWG